MKLRCLHSQSRAPSRARQQALPVLLLRLVPAVTRHAWTLREKAWIVAVKLARRWCRTVERKYVPKHGRHMLTVICPSGGTSEERVNKKFRETTGSRDTAQGSFRIGSSAPGGCFIEVNLTLDIGAMEFKTVDPVPYRCYEQHQSVIQDVVYGFYDQMMDRTTVSDAGDGRGKQEYHIADGVILGLDPGAFQINVARSAFGFNDEAWRFQRFYQEYNNIRPLVGFSQYTGEALLHMMPRHLAENSTNAHYVPQCFLRPLDHELKDQKADTFLYVMALWRNKVAEFPRKILKKIGKRKMPPEEEVWHVLQDWSKWEQVVVKEEDALSEARGGTLFPGVNFYTPEGQKRSISYQQVASCSHELTKTFHELHGASSLSDLSGHYDMVNIKNLAVPGGQSKSMRVEFRDGLRSTSFKKDMKQIRTVLQFIGHYSFAPEDVRWKTGAQEEDLLQTPILKMIGQFGADTGVEEVEAMNHE